MCSSDLAAFLAWEERQELRYEFDGIRPVAMTGGTFAHSVVQSNLMIALGNALRGGPCRAHAGHLKAATAKGYRYPDVFVECAKPRANATVAEPVVVCEVLSESTAGYDRVVKVREYGDTTSIQQYAMLEQDRIAATVFSRESGRWTATLLGEGDSLDFPGIGVSIPLTACYVGVDFDSESHGDADH